MILDAEAVRRNARMVVSAGVAIVSFVSSGCAARPARPGAEQISSPVPAAAPVTPVADPPLPIQIKQAGGIPIRGEPAPFTLGPPGSTTTISIDGRQIPVTSYEGAPLDAIARSLARVPVELRGLVVEIVVSPTPSANDAAWAKKYGLPVLAGMSAGASGKVTIYPHGIDELSYPDGDVFARNFMHELGHCWSVRDWQAKPSDRDAWVSAIKSDRSAPSQYALFAFRNSGLPFEDAAEATALYFLVRGTPAFEGYRARMPARFALLRARFGSSAMNLDQ